MAAPPLERPTVEANMGLVHRVAYRFRWAIGASLDYEDLVSAGTIGLMKACERFEPERGFAFSTYATHWIRHHVGREVANHGRTVRIPVWALEKMRRAGDGLPPSATSLDAPLRANDPEGPTRLHGLEAEPVDPTARREDIEMRQAIEAALSVLPARTRKMLKRRFWRDQTLAAIGKPFRLSRERVRQIEAEALKKLRRLLAKERPDQ